MDGADFVLSSTVVRRAFDRVAAHYDAAAGVQREIGERLLQRLDYLRIKPAVVLDLGAGTGGALGALRRRYPRAQVVAVDLSAAMLRRAPHYWLRRPARVAAAAAALPFATGSIDLLYSNLMLPWCLPPEPVWAEMVRVLRPGAPLLFTTLGPDTLRELRVTLAQLDPGRLHLHPCLDMHDIGDALLRHGIVDPVMDVERLQVDYPSVAAMLAELRASGGGNLAVERARGLGGRLRREVVEAHYVAHQNSGGRDAEQLEQERDSARRTDAAGERITATLEVVYGHGWAGAERAEMGAHQGRQISTGGEIRVPLTALRKPSDQR